MEGPAVPQVEEHPDTVRRADGSVDWPATLAPEKITHKHEFVIHLAALGLRAVEISQRTGYTQAWLSIMLNSPEIAARIVKLRQELMEQSLTQRIRLMAPKALGLLDELMDDPSVKASVRAKVALDVVAHAAGRPQQRIEHTDGNLKQLFEMLDRQQGAPPAGAFHQAKEVMSSVQEGGGEAATKESPGSFPASPEAPVR